MDFYRFSLLMLLFVGIISCKNKRAKLPIDYINPVIGTVTYGEQSKDIHGFGKTFPGAATPFGMVQLSPDTKTGGDCAPGYSWLHSTIEGFSFVHLSGTGWYGEFGNFLVMPTIGKLHTNKGDKNNPGSGYRSRFSHQTEEVKAGYYSVMLQDYNIKTELTAAPRAGILRFTFPENKQSRIQIDLARRIGGTSTEQFVEVENESTIKGWMKCPTEGGGWGNGVGKVSYTLYFYCQISKPLQKFGIWSAKIPDGLVRKNLEVQQAEYQKIVSEAKIYPVSTEMQGKHLGFYTEFSTKKDEKVLLKTGISFVSVENAKENLEKDIPGWDFEQVFRSNQLMWNRAISKIKVEGGTEKEKEIFYTALYHAMIDPRIYSDSNDQYSAADGKIHATEGFVHRTIFSGWDVFRSLFPLFTIIRPDVVNDEINSMLQLAEFSGRRYLPRWEIANSYSGGMIGNPAVSVVVDAYEKGIRDYDIKKAFDYCLKTVKRSCNNSSGFSPGSLSKTLEYAYSDWCMGRFAESLGKDSIAEVYYLKSKSYKSIWSDEVKWFRAKKDDGLWLEWEGKTVHGQGCVESNPYQQGWFVPHDVGGMIELMGEELFKENLIAFFENTPEDFLWNDYYNHANEPVHHVPFLFNEIGMPHLTQKWTRVICKKAYGNDAFGICGNEDEGQMSAWYILASIGIHPLNPGDNKYQVTSPVFSKITISLDSEYYTGKTFTIIAENNSSESIYIQSIKLNGHALNRSWITHEEIVAGGVLELQMGRNPVIGFTPKSGKTGI